ncbi:MAG TPA: DUF5654 family protein [Patescibacteria group bacterium]|nr:DUF5654 family protein [Patescibacteria group bacterium]
MASETTKQKKLRIEIVKQLLTLSTAGFGLVAALAWNSLIQEIVATYIKPYLPGVGIISQAIYAVIITIIAVFVTFQLSKFLDKIESE